MSSVVILIKGLGRGGAEQLLASAAPYLDRERFGYRVAYLLPWKDALVGQLEASGIPAHCLGRGPGWVSRLRTLVRRSGAGVVHAHSPYPAVGARLSLPGVRMVYTEHNVWPRYRRATYWGNVLTFSRNDHVFAVSEDVRRSIRYPAAARRLPMPAVETLYHGLDPRALHDVPAADGVREELGIPHGVPVVGTVGNLTPKKDHATLLRAAARMRRTTPDLRVVVVGTGPLEPRLRALAAELDLGDGVVFAGFREDARRVMGAFDVFVLSSTFEGLPIAMLEAMARGLPVVATGVGGTPEVVDHHRHGLLVEPRAPGPLAEAVEAVLGDASLAARLGEAARRRAGEFDIRRAVRRMEAVYGELVP